MVISINECNCASNDLLALLGAYPSIDKLFTAADKGEVSIPALDIAVRFKGTFHWFRKYGNDIPNRSEWIKEMSSLPKEYRAIPNDTMVIKANSFEKELFITLDMPYELEIKQREKNQ